MAHMSTCSPVEQIYLSAPAGNLKMEHSNVCYIATAISIIAPPSFITLTSSLFPHLNTDKTIEVHQEKYYTVKVNCRELVTEQKIKINKFIYLLSGYIPIKL